MIIQNIGACLHAFTWSLGQNNGTRPSHFLSFFKCLPTVIWKERRPIETCARYIPPERNGEACGRTGTAAFKFFWNLLSRWYLGWVLWVHFEVQKCTVPPVEPLTCFKASLWPSCLCCKEEVSMSSVICSALFISRPLLCRFYSCRGGTERKADRLSSAASCNPFVLHRCHMLNHSCLSCVGGFLGASLGMPLQRCAHRSEAVLLEGIFQGRHLLRWNPGNT